MADTKTRLFAGARAVLKVNGKTIGYCTGISGTETIDYQPVEVLGQADVQEYMLVARRVNFTASFVRILKDSLVASSLFPKGDMATLDLIDFPEMSVTVFDDVEDSAVYKFEGVRPTNRSFTVDKSSVMSVNASFVALTMTDDFVGTF